MQRLCDNLVDMNVVKLEAKFSQILEKAILPLRRRNVFSKYVLLIDEMDKITIEDRILSFLSGNQGFSNNFTTNTVLLLFLRLSKLGQKNSNRR